ncbi:hypothetical protein [Paraburkholderia kururiensis]|uniref:Phage tail protein n=1 Tax=Paraburkholderia kururiensis TaxID=984307 RepID=A0ABZ0WN16_9BURK|nr:hypothetical protein [Paraburkholderia kururiensis]WQD78780.1 hypothetical protein U0042_03455 [Paraburkholderia kururiensis]
MNLQDQIGALETGVDQLIQAVVAARATRPAEAAPVPPAPRDEAPAAQTAEPAAASTSASAASAVEQHAEPEAAAATASEPAAQKPTLEIARPSQNEITMTIAGHMVTLRPEEIGQLIEELSNARASMTPEPPAGLPPGWRFVSTKNPVMAVQKQSNGDRLLVMRHTGHGWVPFTFSPDMVIQMYMMLTQR